MSTIHHIDTIISDTAIRGGQPVIVGTTIRVSDLAASHIYRGQSPEELAANYALDLGQVYAALAYYYQHKAEIDKRMQDDAADADKLLDSLERKGKLIRVE